MFKKSSLLRLTACLGLVCAIVHAEDPEAITVENSSEHQLISQRAYDGYETHSLYITMRDGVRLAADIFRPARGGEVETEPLPLIWTHNRYLRARTQGNRRFDRMFSPTAREMVLRGYIVADVDVRGAGASFGRYEGPFNPNETEDAREIIDWFADQEWCDGNIGMYGGSYLGATQFMATSTKSPHLKAIIPAVAPSDLYAFAHPGGIYRYEFIESWGIMTHDMDRNAPGYPLVAAVDDDPDGRLRSAALKDHRENRLTNEQYAGAPFRDDVDEELGGALHALTSPIERVDDINESGVAVYHLAGWYDCFTRDTLLMFNNLDVPQRMAIGPWFHQQRQSFDNLGEHLRWYDRYLKGVDNGIDDEPPIHYYTIGAPSGERWRTADEWPLPNERRTTYSFHARAQDRTDGILSRNEPKPNPGAIKYVVDYTTSTGNSNRWRNGYGGPGAYVDMSSNDEKGITFTTAPLTDDLEITGHPIANLWVTSTVDDGDFFVYLEEVRNDGYSEYVTEGCLRASHRKLNEPPVDYFGLPYHRSFHEDQEPMSGETAVQLLIELQPTSVIFDKGHRIRVTITCADAENQQTPFLDPAPTITLYCAPDQTSSIELPIISH